MSKTSKYVSRRFTDAAEAVSAAIAHHIEKHKLPAVDNYVDLAQLHESVTGVCAVPYKSLMPAFHRSRAEKEEEDRNYFSVFVYYSDGFERAEVTFDTPIESNEALIAAKKIMNEYGGMEVLSDMPFVAMRKGVIGSAYLLKGASDLFLSVVDENNRVAEYISVPLPKRYMAVSLRNRINTLLEEPESRQGKQPDNVTYLPLSPRPPAE